MYYAVLLLMMILHHYHHQQQYPLQVYEMMFHQQSSHHLRSWPSFLKRPHALCQPTMQTSSKKEANAATATPSFSVLFGLCYSTSFEFEPFVPCRTSYRASVYYYIAGEYEKVLPTNLLLHLFFAHLTNKEGFACGLFFLLYGWPLHPSHARTKVQIHGWGFQWAYLKGLPIQIRS